MANNLQEANRTLIQQRNELALEARDRQRRENGQPPPPLRSMLIPHEIGILPTGNRFHFWPNCSHMRRARSTAGSRIYQACGLCVNQAREVQTVNLIHPAEDVPATRFNNAGPQNMAIEEQRVA